MTIRMADELVERRKRFTTLIPADIDQ